MKCVRQTISALVLAMSYTAMPAIAASYSTDQSDLWWTDPPGSESGWRIQLVQRSSTIFATMFISAELCPDLSSFLSQRDIVAPI